MVIRYYKGFLDKFLILRKLSFDEVFRIGVCVLESLFLVVFVWFFVIGWGLFENWRV